MRRSISTGVKLLQSLRSELEHRQRLLRRQIADEIDDAARLRRRDTHVGRPRKRGADLFRVGVGSHDVLFFVSSRAGRDGRP